MKTLKTSRSLKRAFFENCIPHLHDQSERDINLDLFQNYGTKLQCRPYWPTIIVALRYWNQVYQGTRSSACQDDGRYPIREHNR